MLLRVLGIKPLCKFGQHATSQEFGHQRTDSMVIGVCMRLLSGSIRQTRGLKSIRQSRDASEGCLQGKEGCQIPNNQRLTLMNLIGNGKMPAPKGWPFCWL